ncbi:hypothetical protein [Deinococcus seoulensis]|uniref:hypothetical protein n=1 Tax=Deinococcus seoulensis TaxID=1837379 RepID=UPI001663E990|nr:hypothetical protein [Deinococcus seoulensis]
MKDVINFIVTLILSIFAVAFGVALYFGKNPDPTNPISVFLEREIKVPPVIAKLINIFILILTLALFIVSVISVWESIIYQAR